MSLLNQVLQDLEKRNIDAKNPPDRFRLANIKAVSIVENKNSFLLVIILLITIFSLAVFIFPFLQAQNSPIEPTVAQQSGFKSQKKAIINDAVKKPLEFSTDTAPLSLNKIIQVASPAQKKQPKPNKQSIVAKTISVVKAPLPKEPSIEKPPVVSNTQKAEQLFARAKNQPSSTEKVTALRQIISLNINHIKARLILSNTLLQLGLTLQAATVLDQSLILFPQHLPLINLRSQLFLQNKQAKAALNVLQQIDANYINDENYLSLLASAYQQNKQHLNSLQNYRKLLKINPSKANYWLGVAIAEDNLGNNPSAISAYQQALDKNTLQAVIVSYINQRISVLK